MSTVDLILLGVLLEKPMNAYEMKKILEFRNIKTWVKISNPSIYKNLLSLSKRGYLDNKVIKEGEMPEKTIYFINDKGKDYFVKLMENYAEEPGMVYIDFTAFVANLHNIDPLKGYQLITTLKERLGTKLESIQWHIDYKKDAIPQHANMMMELYKRMYQLFSDWCEEFGESYKITHHL